MRLAETVCLAGGGLDRLAGLRSEAAALAGREGARVLPVWRGRVMLGRGTTLGFVPVGHPLLADAALVFLGGSEDAPVFAADVSHWQPDDSAPGDMGPGLVAEDQPVTGFDGLPHEARFGDLRGLLAALTPREAEIAASARGILEWHRSHGFCANCGAPSVLAEGGWRRDCPACGRQHFPRTDPVVIMLVTRGDRVLVGRSPGWPEGMYSLLAGFMEPGETVATAVRREVMEEAGVPVGPVKMLASQPWPFPASLMIGCAADALADTITLDPVELEDARWIGRQELLAAFAGRHPEIRPPRAAAIAGFLLKMWLADRLD